MAVRKPAPPPRRPGTTVGDTLARSVISRPLDERIQRELGLADAMRTIFADARKRHATAIVLNRHFPAGSEAARKVVLAMLDAYAVRQHREPSRQLVQSRHPRAAAGDVLLGSLDEHTIAFLKGRNKVYGGPIDLIWPARWEVIIDINLKFRERVDRGRQPGAIAPREAVQNPITEDPRKLAKQAIIDAIAEAKRVCNVTDPLQRVDDYKTGLSDQYVFARLEGRVVRELVRIDRAWGDEGHAMAQGDINKLAANKGAASERIHAEAAQLDPKMYRAVHQIWPDFDLHSCIHRSARTVKADAAHNSFGASGEGITWAVIDSGVDWRHPHFAMHGNVDRTSPFHRDFTALAGDPLVDEKGHGTHVAGIIAGQQARDIEPAAAIAAPYAAASRLESVEQERDSAGADGGGFVAPANKTLAAIAGIAPRCKIVSLKVLDEFGQGKASNVIAAIGHIQLINGYGRDVKIHGANLSLGHEFEAEWFACGHSPLCVEVNRLVRSGVVVVIAAGNSGYGVLKSMGGDRNSALGLSINDPGNAELAITVGATHRDAPHMYGVSYFSSKGPTGDGRCKPDLIAPGERIVSAAAAGSELAAEFPNAEPFAYCESSGTSMAAPHVSGAVAAFLSIRNEFIGEAEKVKRIFTSSATDLGRERYFQGAGLVDLLRAIQSV